MLNGIGLGIQLACLGFTVHVLGYSGKVPANIALIAGIVIGTLFRFWSYRKWVWATNKPPPRRATSKPMRPSSPCSRPVAGSTVAGPTV